MRYKGWDGEMVPQPGRAREGGETPAVAAGDRGEGEDDGVAVDALRDYFI